MKLIENVREKARQTHKRIVLPESTDERVVAAAVMMKSEKIATPILVGNPDSISQLAERINISIKDIEIVDPISSNRYREFVEAYYEKRKHKGTTLGDAESIMINPTFWGAMMVEKNLADGCVSGAITTTGNVLRAALQIIGTKPETPTVSSDILIITPNADRIWSFADCAVLPDPTAEQLADIAIATAETHRKVVKEEPRVAMLSFSTKGSAKHAFVEKVSRATEIVKKKRPDLIIDGELQLDAAIVPKVCEKKAPGSPIAGNANVLIFPDLGSGNIGYKLVQRIGGCEAIGPIIQGLKKPMNDLLRGCSTEDIVNLSAILCNLA
jgi:phosphate acetyltransferase